MITFTENTPKLPPECLLWFRNAILDYKKRVDNDLDEAKALVDIIDMFSSLGNLLDKNLAHVCLLFRIPQIKPDYTTLESVLGEIRAINMLIVLDFKDIKKISDNVKEHKDKARLDLGATYKNLKWGIEIGTITQWNYEQIERKPDVIPWEDNIFKGAYIIGPYKLTSKYIFRKTFKKFKQINKFFYENPDRYDRFLLVIVINPNELIALQNGKDYLKYLKIFHKKIKTNKKYKDLQLLQKLHFLIFDGTYSSNIYPKP